MVHFNFRPNIEKKSNNIRKGYGDIRPNQTIPYGTFSKLFISGIYEIKCKETQKVYIGASSNIAHRVQKHFSELRLNKHRNKKLQEDYNIYGFDSFEVNCLEETNSNLLLKEKEYQIKKGIDNIYNEKISGYFITEELREMHKKVSKDSHKTKEYRDKMSKRCANRFAQFDKHMHLIKIYDNWKDIIAENPTYKIQPIRGVCNGSKASAYSCIWRYVDENDNIVIDGFEKRRNYKFKDIV